MHRVVFGLSAFAGALTGQVRIEGCNTAATGPNNLRTCSSTPSLPDNVAADDPDTFTIGPPANLPSPVQDDSIYVSLVGAIFRGLGVPDSLNIAGDEALLGFLEFDNSVSDPPVPEISFDGVTSLPGVTVEFEASDGTTITAAQVRTISGFDSQDDGDGDGAGDEIDNCPFIFNPGQENGGGVNTLVPNAFGDLCECGDGNGDGPVFSNDIQALQQALAGLLEDLSVLDRCSVVGGTECDILDIVTLGQVLDQGGTLEPDCSAANP